VTGLPRRPWASILLVGPTGAGKSPLGDEMERRGFQGRPCLHFDFGANLRAAASGRAAVYGLTSPETDAVLASLRTGALFEAGDLPLIIKVLSRFAEMRGLRPGDRLVLNGLPRHRSQAEALRPTVEVERVVSLEAGPAVILERLRLDPGRDRTGRTDDGPAAVVARLETFRERTSPLLDYYRRGGVPVMSVPVTATMTAGEMYEELVRRSAG
jgi:adenylate kinase